MTHFSHKMLLVGGVLVPSVRYCIPSSGFGRILQVQKRGLKRPPVNTSQLNAGRRTGALAMKVGMLPMWDKWGVRFTVTVLQVDNCFVVQHKTIENEGYEALQLSVGEAKTKNVRLPQRGHFFKSGVLPGRQLQEFRITPDAALPIGTQVKCTHFVPGQLVDVCGISKGKGFQGAMKRHNFSGGRATHGNSKNHRTLGSTGGAQDPGRTFKGQKMPGRMGGERVTTQNLKVMRLDPSRNVLYIKGAVPGPKGSFVRITDAVKGPFFPRDPPFPTFLEDEDPVDEEYLVAPAGDTDVLMPSR
jgi:large subunit ribosomal protein L3